MVTVLQTRQKQLKMSIFRLKNRKETLSQSSDNIKMLKGRRGILVAHDVKIKQKVRERDFYPMWDVPYYLELQLIPYWTCETVRSLPLKEIELILAK